MIKLVAEINGKYPKELSADAGFFSTENVEWLQEKNITAYVAPDKQKHNDRAAIGPRGRIPNDIPLPLDRACYGAISSVITNRNFC